MPLSRFHLRVPRSRLSRSFSAVERLRIAQHDRVLRGTIDGGGLSTAMRGTH